MAASDMAIPASTLCSAIRRVLLGDGDYLAEPVQPVDGEDGIGCLG